MMVRFSFLCIASVVSISAPRAQNIGINTDGSAAESNVMLDVKGINDKATTGTQTVFQVKSNNTTSPDDAFKLRIGLRTHTTSTSRYGFLDLADMSAGTPTYRLLTLQPSGGNVTIGSTSDAMRLNVFDNVNGSGGIYSQNISTGVSALGMVSAASDLAQITMAGFSSTHSDVNKRQRVMIQSEIDAFSLDLSNRRTTAGVRFFPGNTYGSANQNIPAGTPVLKVEPPDATHTNGRFGLIEGGASPSFYTYFKGGNQTAEINYTLPIDDGTSGQMLTTDGNGVLSWTTPGGAASASGNWSLVGVANSTIGSTADFFTTYNLVANKEYLIVGVGSASEFTLATSDAVAVFGPLHKNISSGVNYSEGVAVFATGHSCGCLCDQYSLNGFMRLVGRKTNSATTAIVMGGATNTLCTAVNIQFKLRGDGIIGATDGDPSNDVGLYIFER